MTPDPNDELAALTEPTLEQTARTNAMIGATRITAAEAGLWSDEIAFLPLAAAEAERQSIRRGPLGQPLIWDNIVTMYQRMFYAPLRVPDPWSWIPYIDPTDPDQVASAHAAAEAYADYMKGQSTGPRPRSLYEGNWPTQEPA